MKYYYIGLPRYQILGQMLADYLKVDMHPIYHNWDDIYKIKEDDLVYCHYFQPDIIEGKCTIVAPKLEVAKKWDDKIYQYDHLFSTVKIPHYEKHDNYIDLIKSVRDRDVFITLPDGNTGDNSIIHRKGDNTEAIGKKLKLKVGEKINVRVSEFIDKDFAVSIHAVIKQIPQIYDQIPIYISPPVRQRIGDDGMTFEGGEYPPRLNDAQTWNLYTAARKIAEVLGHDGYVGLVGIDFMFKGDDLYFCEINPRKMGTTIGISMVMEHEIGITLPVFEYLAVTNQSFPILSAGGMYNLEWKIDMHRVAPEYQDKAGDEADLFKEPGSVKYYDGDFYFNIESRWAE